MELLKRVKAHDGYIKRYCHESETTKCKMTFSVFLPSVASDAHKVPVVFYLAGLTCNDELFFTKASNALKAASMRGIAIVCPDTRCFKAHFSCLNALSQALLLVHAASRSKAKTIIGISAQVGVFD